MTLLDEGKSPIIDVRMNDVVFGYFGEGQRQFKQMIGMWIGEFPMESQGLLTSGNVARSGLGIPACKERDFMTSADEFLSQERDNPFRPPIKARRNALKEGRNLSDSHANLLLQSVSSFRNPLARCFLG